MARIITPTKAKTPNPVPASSWTPAGGGQYVGGGPTNVPGGNNQARPAAPAAPTGPTPTPQEDRGGGGGSIDTGSTASNYTPPPAAFSASQLLENVMFAATGISGLGPWAGDLYNRGASPTEIVQALRYGTDTSDAGKTARASYLKAFPKMDVLLKESILTGESPEMQYLAYRNDVKSYAQRYGIMDTLVDNEKIATYMVNQTSASEIGDRMALAANAVATTPAETVNILKEYYGVQAGDLISFYLDPDTTEDILKKRYTAARVGTEAARQQFGITATEAESLVQRGVTAGESTTAAFGEAANRQAFMGGPGETATREDILSGTFGDQAAANKLTRIGKSRAGQFEQGGSFVTTEKGVAGLGMSTGG